MSSEAAVPRTAIPVGIVVPRTAVPLGISDPVERARTELKATLAAIEEKANVPRRVSRATEPVIRKARAFAKRNPAGASGIIAAAAAAVGAIVWAAVRVYSR